MRRIHARELLPLAVALAGAIAAPCATSDPPPVERTAVFTDGRSLRVIDARAEGTRMVLELPGGGRLEVPLQRVERVVLAELFTPPSPPAPPPCAPGWAEEALPDDLPYAELMEEAARKADLHPWLLAAVVHAESAFEPRAVSRAGAQGLCQLMPSAQHDHGVEDPFDPAQNLRGGAAHLRRLLDRYGSLPLALAAYNAGPSTVDRHGGVPPYRETHAFIRRVHSAFCPWGEVDPSDPEEATKPATSS